MADEAIVQQVVKSDICWLEISVGRHPVKGLDIWARSVPEIEEFFKNMGIGRLDPPEAYDKCWVPYSPAEPLQVYRLEQSLPDSNGVYVITNPGSPIRVVDKNFPRGIVNLSFLRLKGLSSPEGVRFYVRGIYSRPYTEQVSDEIIKQTRSFIRDYIVPVTVNLRISSTLI